MEEIKYKIVKQIGVLSRLGINWQKELNIISWNENEPKYDIRSWSKNHEKMKRGITLTKYELAELYKLIGEELEAIDYKTEEAERLKKEKKEEEDFLKQLSL